MSARARRSDDGRGLRATVHGQARWPLASRGSLPSCIRAVLWGFLGFRRRQGADQDQAQRRPLPLIATAPGLAALLVLGLLVLAASATAATVADTMAQRALACTGCHTPQGQASAQGYIPRIAGKPAGYLAAQLRAFRDGQRQQDAMARLLANLDDAFLAELASHFAGQPLDRRPVPGEPAPAPSQAVGRRLVQQGDGRRELPACVACHGAAMTGIEPAIPGLLGLPRDYLVAQLGAWRIGTRKATAPDCMAQVAQRLTPADITAVADWLAAQPVPDRRGAAPALQRQLPLPCGSVTP